MQNNLQPANPKDLALKKLAVARSNLILMIALTAINVVFFAIGTETMLLFSATVPYFIAIVGFVSESAAVLTVSLVITAVILLLYLLCWIFSKNNYGWMVAALVLFSIDTAAMVMLYVTAKDFTGVLDVLIHIWVLYYLIIGVKYGRKLKNITPEEEAAYQLSQAAQAVPTVPPVIQSESTATRPADNDVKFRVLADATVGELNICYRRVKRVNELVINGFVYDEVEMLLETAHELKAMVNGHLVTVGFDGVASYIHVDGVQVKRKVRLI